MSRGGAKLLRHRGIAATGGVAVLVVVAGSAYAATASHQAGHESLATVGGSRPASHQPVSRPKPVGPLRLLSVTPANGDKDANGGGAITLRFTSALSATTPLPTLSPSVPGSWKIDGATATFTPASGFLPDTKVTLKVPGSMAGAAVTAGTLQNASRVSYTTGTYSTLRLEQVLAQLGYLPLNFSPADPSGTVPAGSMSAQVAAAYNPPAGTFTFQPGYPSTLTSMWHTGSDNMLVQGAIRAFEFNVGLPMDGVAGPQVWAHLLQAAAQGKRNPNGYSYALAHQGPSNETLQVWHDGKRILDTPANTGISASPTADGTFPVYERLQFQIMKGTNPDGSKYADPVSWISYFNGGDAIHGFVRASYGWYQSLGCVELPPTTAQQIWPYLTYGTLVTVTGLVA